MPSDTRVTLNTEVAAAKLIDDEVIIINVITGHYYSLEGTASFVWRRLSQAASVDEIARDLSERYDVGEAQAQADLEQLVADLREHRLVVPLPPAHRQERLEANLGSAGQRLPYTPARLQVFTDMADLLKVDPPLPSGAPEVWQAPRGA